MTPQQEPQLSPAGFARRLGAYLIDTLPILIVVTAAFYFFFGFDETIRRRFDRAPDDTDAVLNFHAERRFIRNVWMGIYIVYSAVMESSAWRATLGKRLLGVQVVDKSGGPMTYTQAAKRNGGKILSGLVFGLGFLWALWDREGRTWHDMLADARVVRVGPPPADSQALG